MKARSLLVYGAAALVAAALGSCAPKENPKLAAFEAAEQAVAGHLTTFDTLDFQVFTHQQWERFHESHSQDVKVHWPDGHVTEGLAKHIEDLKALFVYAPDTRIQVHSIKIGSGEWTSVVGVMEGTFTQPMPMGNGKVTAPTHKAFKITMCTVGHWKNGVMDEEYLFWDNLTYLRQIGIMQ